MTILTNAKSKLHIIGILVERNCLTHACVSVSSQLLFQFSVFLLNKFIWFDKLPAVPQTDPSLLPHLTVFCWALIFQPSLRTFPLQPQLHWSSSVMVRISVTRPVPMVLFPSLRVNLWPFSSTMGWRSVSVNDASSPGITISLNRATQSSSGNNLTCNLRLSTWSNWDNNPGRCSPCLQVEWPYRPCPRWRKTWRAWSWWRTACVGLPPPYSEYKPGKHWTHCESRWLITLVSNWHKLQIKIRWWNILEKEKLQPHALLWFNWIQTFDFCWNLQRLYSTDVVFLQNVLGNQRGGGKQQNKQM